MMNKMTDSGDEIRKRIFDLHLSYLEREETPDKLDFRTRLEGLIVDYLSLVPHARKFTNFQVANCLTRSIIENIDFSAYKAANAFESLEKFATNLLTQPWRKEYKVIYPYSGFYRHNIEKQLIGAEEILYLMGYELRSSNGIVLFQLKDDIPIDPDRLARVSLDCLIGFVECQMMIQIGDALKRKRVSASWSEIYAVRVEYVCGMEDVVELLCDLEKNAKLIDYDEMPSLSSKYSNYKNCRTDFVDSSMNGDWKNVKVNNHYHTPKKAEYYVAENTGYSYDSDNFEPCDSFDLMHFPMTGEQYPPPPPRSSNIVPYSALTYIPPPPAMFASNLYDPYLRQTLPQNFTKSQQAGVPREDLNFSFNKLSTREKSEQHQPQIDKRTRISSTSSTSSSATKKDDPIKNYFRDSHSLPSKNNNNFEHLDERICENEKLPVIRKKPNSNLPQPLDEVKPYSLVSPQSSLPPSSQNNHSVSPRITSNFSEKIKDYNGLINTASDNLYTEEIKEPMNAMKKENLIARTKSIEKTWPCLSCTYINRIDREICEMCSRSRSLGEESAPLVSGGRECPRCTLVNTKELENCTACNASLADSPTYI